MTLTTANDETIDFGFYAAAPGIHIVKLTNGTNNDTGTGPLVPVGSTVTWTYNVTNTGNVPLSDVTVTDDHGVTPVLPRAATPTTTACSSLAETWVYTASGTAVAGQYSNVGTATGTPVDDHGNPIPGTTPPTATNPDHYYGTLSLGDFVWNDVNAQRHPGRTATTGINGVTVDAQDSGGNVIATTTTGNNPVGGATRLLPVQRPAPGQLHVVVATPSGYVASPSLAGRRRGTGQQRQPGRRDPDHRQRRDHRLRLLRGSPGIHLVKLTNGTDNDTGTGPLVPVGSTVTWTYNVTNTGNVPLTDVTVTDDHGVTPVSPAPRRRQQQRPARPERDLGLHRHRHRRGRPVHQRRHRHRHAGRRPRQPDPGHHPADRHQPRPLLRHAVDRRLRLERRQRQRHPGRRRHRHQRRHGHAQGQRRQRHRHDDDGQQPGRRRPRLLPVQRPAAGQLHGRGRHPQRLRRQPVAAGRRPRRWTATAARRA